MKEKDLTKLNKYQQKTQKKRTEEINRLLTAIGTGLPMRVRISIDTHVPALPYDYELEDEEGEKRRAEVIKRGYDVAEKLFPEDKATTLEFDPPVGAGTAFGLVPKQPRPIRKYAAKLTDNQVRLIRSMLKEGFTNKAVAKKLCIGTGVVSRVKTGAAYAHVPDTPIKGDSKDGK